MLQRLCIPVPFQRDTWPNWLCTATNYGTASYDTIRNAIRQGDETSGINTNIDYLRVDNSVSLHTHFIFTIQCFHRKNKFRQKDKNSFLIWIVDNDSWAIIFSLFDAYDLWF